MKIPTLVLTAVALGLTGCATYAPAPGAYGPARVSVATKAPFGTYLVGPNGMSLYILEGERGTTGMSRCSGECLNVWPPLHASGTPIAGPGADPARLGVVTMHGAPHVTYDGWPLYYYHHDRVPGDTTGQHVTDAWGTWHLLSPSGQPIRPAGSGY